RGGGGDLNFVEESRDWACAHNVGPSDANSLQTYFLEKSGEELAVIKRLIDANSRVNGWLIFATHDVAASPSKLGCSTGFFEKVVGCAAASKSQVMPVADAWPHVFKGRKNGQ